MDLKQLKYFVAIVDQGGVRKAADVVHISQPSLTNAIHNLEADLGVKLFARSGRALEPTTEGYHFYKRARALLNQAEQARAEMRSFISLEKAEIRIAVPVTIASYVLADPIGVFLEKYPNVRLCLMQMSGPEAESALLLGDIDLAILSRPFSSGEISAHEITSRRLCAMVRGDHALSKEGKVTWSQILDHPIASLPQHYSLYEILDDHANRNKKALNIILESDVVPLVVAATRQTNAVSLLLEDVAEREKDLIKLEIIDDSKNNDANNIRILACTLKGRPLSIGAEALLKHLQGLK